MSNGNNWIALSSIVTESDRKLLEKAKRHERMLEKENWRWYKINNRIRVLVPFGEDGKPTPEGERIIAKQRELL